MDPWLSFVPFGKASATNNRAVELGMVGMVCVVVVKEMVVAEIVVGEGWPRTGVAKCATMAVTAIILRRRTALTMSDPERCKPKN
jgi:hypothetical protein